MTTAHLHGDFDFNVTIDHINDRQPNPHWKIDRTINDTMYVIGYCRDGEALYTYNGKQVEVRKGDMLLFPKGFVRSAASNPDNPWSFISVTFDVLFQNEQSREQFDRLDILIRSPHLYKLSHLFHELNQVWTGKRNGFSVKCRSILMDILYRVIREQDRTVYGSSRYNAIETTANHILQHYADSFSIEELARLAGLSPSHFRLLFKKIMGMTTVQYQNHIRVGKARDLLLGGHCNVTEAALAVGFQDIYYFSRLFKKLTGENPSDCISV
jgi:AraC-like DNA-binding protein